MRWILLLLWAACGKPLPTPTTPPIVSDATAVFTFRPTEFPVLAMLDAQPDMLECWRKLEEKIEITYQVFIGRTSYFVLDGDLPRSDVETCIGKALVHVQIGEAEIKREGELSIIATKLGTVYAAWPGKRMIVGTRTQVEQALAATTPPKWMQPGDFLTPAALTTTAFAGAAVDPAFGNVLGVPTTRWRMQFDGAPRPWPERELVKDDGGDELERFGREQQKMAERKERVRKGLPADEPPKPRPEPRFSARLELTFGSPAQAKQAADNLGKATFAIPLEDNLAAALSKLPTKITDSTLAITFDQSSFPGVELEKLQAWVATLQQPR